MNQFFQQDYNDKIFLQSYDHVPPRKVPNILVRIVYLGVRSIWFFLFA